MLKNLVKHGNSWALVIDRPILELLKTKSSNDSRSWSKYSY